MTGSGTNRRLFGISLMPAMGGSCGHCGRGLDRARPPPHRSLRTSGAQTGPTSTWLWTELNKMGLPVICIDARHAKAALKLQINKSDRNDAVGIARIMQCGWYKEVRVKDLDSHALKALLVSRALLVKIKRDIEADDPPIRIRGDRLDGPNLQMRR